MCMSRLFMGLQASAEVFMYRWWKWHQRSAGKLYSMSLLLIVESYDRMSRYNALIQT